MCVCVWCVCVYVCVCCKQGLPAALISTTLIFIAEVMPIIILLLNLVNSNYPRVDSRQRRYAEVTTQLHGVIGSWKSSRSISP